MIRVAPYSRVSTDAEDQVNSLENQVGYYKDLVKSRSDWVLVDMYIDEGITGTNTKKRKDFKRLIEDAFAGKIDLILTKEVSRFARNTVDTLSYTRALKAIGVGVFFINDNIDTRDKDGEFRLTIMASVAQEESRKTSERVKWGMKRQMERGYVFANTIYGFEVNKGSIAVNDEEAKIVRLIFNKFVYDGKGALTIAKDLMEQGIPVAKGKRMVRWSATAISRILRNEKYVGDLLQKKTYIPDYLEHKSVRNDGQEEQVYIRDHHEGIIDREVWELAQAELKKRAIQNEDKGRYSNSYWCSGKIFCSECGSSCVARTKNLKSKDNYKAWRCKGVSTYGKLSGCSNGQINMKALEYCLQFAYKQIDMLSDAFILELHEDIKKAQAQNVPQDLVGFKSDIEALKRKKEKIIDLMLDGSISKEEMNSMKIRYDKEINEVSNKILKIEDSNRKQNELTERLTEILDKIKTILSQEKPTTELYRQIVEKIILYPTNDLDIYLKYIPEPIYIHFETSGRGKNYNTICSLREPTKNLG